MQVSTSKARVAVGTKVPKQLTADAIYDMLSNSRRRYLLYHLREFSEVSVRELSRRMAAWENNIKPSVVRSQQRKRLYTALHQTHLPHLNELGVVEYDRDCGVVKAKERLSIFEPSLEDVQAEGGRWPQYYLAVGISALFLGVGISTNLPGLASIPSGVALLFVGAVITVLATHQADPRTPDLPTGLSGLRPSHEPPMRD